MGVWAPLASDVTRRSQCHLCATHRSGRGGLVPSPVAGAAGGAPCPQLEGREGQSPGPGTCHCCGRECPQSRCECPQSGCARLCSLRTPHRTSCPGGACGDTPGRAGGPGAWAGRLGAQRGCAGTWGMHEGLVRVFSAVTSCLCRLERRRACGCLVGVL